MKNIAIKLTLLSLFTLLFSSKTTLTMDNKENEKVKKENIFQKATKLFKKKPKEPVSQQTSTSPTNVIETRTPEKSTFGQTPNTLTPLNAQQPRLNQTSIFELSGNLTCKDPLTGKETPFADFIQQINNKRIFKPQEMIEKIFVHKNVEKIVTHSSINQQYSRPLEIIRVFDTNGTYLYKTKLELEDSTKSLLITKKGLVVILDTTEAMERGIMKVTVIDILNDKTLLDSITYPFHGERTKESSSGNYLIIDAITYPTIDSETIIFDLKTGQYFLARSLQTNEQYEYEESDVTEDDQCLTIANAVNTQIPLDHLTPQMQ